MADKHEKLVLPKDVALAVLNKVGEMLQKSELAKKHVGFKAVEESAKEGGASDPAAVAAAVGRKKYGKKAFQEAAAAGHKMGKAENPDKDEDAKLGEKVEHDVEDHMLENKDAEKQEGHKIFKCETCGSMYKAETKHDRCVEHVKENSPGVSDPHAVCVAEGVKPSKWKKSEELYENLEVLAKTLGEEDRLSKSENYNDPSPKSGQGETLTPDKKKVDWQEKSEMEKHGLSPEEIKARIGKSEMDKHGLSPEEIKSKLKKYETENSKKLGYKLSQEGKEEVDPEASDKAFKVEHKDDKSSDDERLNGQTNPHENKKEQAEGNNEEAGTTPTQVGQDGKNKPGYDEIKGHLKLAKFIGRMEHKRELRGAQSQTNSSAQHSESIRDKK